MTALRTMARDLGLGVRFAAAGGREGRLRTALTALGVGLGVVLLLGAASVPSVLGDRTARADARVIVPAHQLPRSDTSFLYIDAGTEFHGRPVDGTLMHAEGPGAQPPPGVSAIPEPGSMVVSPALRELMNSPGGALLRQRLPFTDTGTIASSGLLDPDELVYYAGDSALSTGRGAHRGAAYGVHEAGNPLDPTLFAVVALVFVVLLVPVVVFVATAVRFGGERRDRRLAALRLVGADAHATRRMAAGEALFGAAAGLVAGGAMFAVARQFAGGVRLWGVSAYPDDIMPSPLLAAVVVAGVLVTSVGAALFALRSVSIEPLGVVRDAELRPRRLWWRLVLPATGIVTLVLTQRFGGTIPALHTTPVVVGSSLTLIGLVGLLPWLVEKSVARMRGGPVPWQLATRRLQLSGASSARSVGGITVAVAGAVLLQMVFGGIQDDFAHPDGSTGALPTAASPAAHGEPRAADVTVRVDAPDGNVARRLASSLAGTRGVSSVATTVEAYTTPVSPPPDVSRDYAISAFTVGDCASLRAFAHIPTCHDGDTFLSRTSGLKGYRNSPGEVVALEGGNSPGRTMTFTVPQTARTVRALPGWEGESHAGILATPAALDAAKVSGGQTWARVWLHGPVPDGVERVRTAAARIEPAAHVDTLLNQARDTQFASVQTGLAVGGTATMALIAASLLVAQIEQLRERRRLLSVLVAFGTRRITLAWSVLWQTAVPVVVGTILAVAGGVALGTVTLDLLKEPVKSWWVFWPYAGAGAGVVLLVTLASLAPLWRLMRPDGLRTE